MRSVQIRGTAKKIKHLVQLSKQALREGAYRVANRLHAVALNMEGRTAPEIADVLKVHRSNVCLWLERWQVDGNGGDSGRTPRQAVRRLFLNTNASSWPTSWSPARWLMALPPVSGLAR